MTTTWWGITILCVVCVAVWILLSALLYRVFFKRFYDIVLSFVAIIVLSPLLLVLMVVGAIAMKGNPFFVQRRPGRRKKLSKKECEKLPYGTYGEERIIRLIKLRTMTNEKDENGNLLPDEKRLTRYGKWLRSSSCDELFSLFNIFIGDLSIVGPRPLLVKYLPLYNEEQRHRHDVRPGLTGLAQVNGRNGISWDEKFALDTAYVRKITMWRDIKIILQTIGKVFKRSGISQEGQATMEEFTGKKSGRNPLISVIVPIYNIEKYVGECIGSLTAQTFTDIEIIAVDDGSTDNSGKICDELAAKDKRIKVIHKNNEGLVAARKTGLKAAAGEYVGYVDGDDRVGKDFYSTLFNAAEKYGGDVVAAGFSRDFMGKIEEKMNGVNAGHYSGEELENVRTRLISCGDVYVPGIYTYVWNKLFRRSVLEKFQNAVPDEITIGEDAAVVFPLLSECNSVSVIADCSYKYRQHEQSMIKKSDWSQSNGAGLKALVKFLQSGIKAEFANQVNDFLLNLFLIHSGGRVGNEFVFGKDLTGKRLALFSAGTFGQYIMKGGAACGLNIVSWVDDDGEEYRACGLDVQPVDSLTKTQFDYVLIATTNNVLAVSIKNRLTDMGVPAEKVFYFDFDPKCKETAFMKYANYYGVSVT